MQPKSKAEISTMIGAVTKDLLNMLEESGLSDTHLATLLDTTRLTVHNWKKKELPKHRVSAHLFMNILIARILLKKGLAEGTLPVDGRKAGDKWVRTVMAIDITR